MENKLLGKAQGDYSEYKDITEPTPEVLVPVARSIERDKIIEYDAEPVPMLGFDTWHGYEVSVLTDKGLPVNFVAKVIYNADSPNIVESKSMKLYWNSFNMHRLASRSNIKKSLIEKSEADLSAAIGSKVQVNLFDTDDYFYEDKVKIKYNNTNIENFRFIDSLDTFSVDELTIEDYNDKIEILANGFPYSDKIMQLKTDMLRSNCKVTHQPDFGDLYIHFQPNDAISPNWASVLKYIISFRQESHFHEEIVERIYHSLYTVYKPKALMVGARYTRRGGWDINPFRASNYSLFANLIEADINLPDYKTGRQ